ncbi:MAG: hypothetical protein WBG19_07390 [Thermoplasmata archaeon]
MQAPGAAGSPAPAAMPSKMNLGTMLAVVAIVIALVALAVNFVVPGPAGSSGPAGPTAGAYWAVVNHNGTLVAGSGATSAENKSTGVYQVSFSADVSGCALLASVGIAGAEFEDGASIASVTGVSGNSHAVQVSVTNMTTLMPKALGFSVVAVCSSTLFADVSSTGGLVHGNGAVSATWPAAGLYTVTFDQSISNCSYLASPGATGIATVARALSSPDTVNVTTWNDAGTATDLSFNLVVLCGNAANWAVVNTTGVELRGSSNGTEGFGIHGGHQVNITGYSYNCAVIGTIGLAGPGTPVPGELTYAGRVGNDHAFWVVTFGVSGISAEEPFHFGAFC